MKLLVTGASGLIGRHVVALAAGMDDVELIASSRNRPANLPERAVFVAADLSHPSRAAALVRSQAPTHIIHAAWETTHPTYWEDPVNLDWAIATGRMAEEFAQAGGERFVQLGSCAEYDWSHELCIEGETPDRPTTRYGKSKLAAFRLVEAAAHRRFEAVEARIFFVFGPGENEARLIPMICRSHLAGQVPELGSGRQKRDLLFVEDAASALLALARSKGVEGVVNIGAGEEIRLADVAAKLAQLAGSKESGIGRRSDREGDPERLIAASDRLRSTDWKPRYRLEEGLRKTFEWWRVQVAGGRS